jgi:osmotically-inducible protein OsmY
MRPIAALAAALLAATLAACGKPNDPQTAGEKVDATVAKTQQMATDIKEGVKTTAADAAQATERVAAGMGDKVKDAAITSAVNAKLAQDKSLSVLRIDVDTVNGRVVLKGNAPDTAARDRAQALAAAVEGVVSVDNQLVVSKG